MSEIEITQADRDLLVSLSDWLFEITEGKVRIVATDDTFAPLKMFARHRHEARAEALGEALTTIALLPTGKTEDVMEGHEQAYRAIEDLRSGEREG